MRDKVLGYGWPFSPRESSNSTRRPRLFDWTDDPARATVDVSVHMSHAIRKGVGKPGRKLAWLHESPQIARWQRTTPFIEENLDAVMASYEAVLTPDRELCKLHPRIVYHPGAANLPWIRETQYAIYRKTKLCSMFASMKEMVAAHFYRREVASRLQDKLDLFGGACGSPRIGGDATHPDKSEGMVPYMFQVVMENAQADFYYTEKITDCFATGTVPIYWGSDCIGELFDTDGIIRFDDDFDIDSLNDELYYSMMPAIRHNFRLVQELEGTDDLLYRRFIKPPSDGIVTPWRVGSWAERQVLESSKNDEGPTHLAPRAKPAITMAWDARRILSPSSRAPTPVEQRLEIVTSRAKENVGRLAEVAAEQTSIRPVNTTLVPPRSLNAKMPAGWPQQLTEAFLLHVDDAYIGDGVAFDRDHYFSMGRWWLGRNWRFYRDTEDVRHVDAAVSVHAWGGEAFQHFIVDALPQLATVIEALETPELAHVRIVSHDEPGKAAQWFWTRLGLEQRIVRKPINSRSGFVIHADKVLYPQFEPNLDHLGIYPRNILRPIQERLGVLDDTKQDLAVFLRRRKRRKVANETQLLDAVRQTIAPSGLRLHVFPGGMSPSDGESVIKRAKVVFGPHGGAFGNLVFAQPGTHVIEFVPLSDRVRSGATEPLTMYYGLAQSAGLDYWFVEPREFDLEQPKFDVDVDEVVAILKRILDGDR